VLAGLSEIAMERRDFASAERYVAEALAIERESDSPPSTVARALRRLAAVQQARGAFGAAEVSLLEAADLASARQASPRPSASSQ